MQEAALVACRRNQPLRVRRKISSRSRLCWAVSTQLVISLPCIAGPTARWVLHLPVVTCHLRVCCRAIVRRSGLLGGLGVARARTVIAHTVSGPHERWADLRNNITQLDRFVRLRRHVDNHLDHQAGEDARGRLRQLLLHIRCAPQPPAINLRGGGGGGSRRRAS